MSDTKPTFYRQSTGTEIQNLFDVAQEIVTIGQTSLTPDSVDRLLQAVERMRKLVNTPTFMPKPGA